MLIGMDRKVFKQKATIASHFVNFGINSIGKALISAAALGLAVTTCGSVLAAEDSAGRSRKAVRVSTKWESSITTVTFKTGDGQIRVLLPADIRPGDTFVGSTNLEPNGRNDTDRDLNRSLLAGYTISLSGASLPVKDATQRWTLPADLKADSVVMTLLDDAGHEAAHVVLPLRAQSSTGADSGIAALSAAGHILLPSRGTVRRPLVFAQGIPGGIDDVHVLIGDREARLLAASPRCYIVESPGDVTGKTTLKVKRGSEVLAESNFRNNRPSSVNPWPFIIVIAVVGILIEVATTLAQAAVFQSLP